MAKIHTYPPNEDISMDDQLLGTDNNTGKPTNNFFIGNIVEYIDNRANSGNLDTRHFKMILDDFNFSSIPVNYDNAVWVIRYNHDLNGSTITLPENVTLMCAGGTISNGTINFDNTLIECGNTIFLYSITVGTGSIINSVILPEWFGALGNGTTSDTVAWNTALSFTGSILGNPYATYLVGALNIYSDTHIDLNGSTLERNTSELNGHTDFYNNVASIFHIADRVVHNISIINGIINDKNTEEITVHRPFMTSKYSNVEDALFENLIFLDSRHGFDNFSDLATNVLYPDGAIKRFKMRNCNFLSPYVPTRYSAPSELSINNLLFVSNSARYCNVESCHVENTNGLALINQNDVGYPCSYNIIKDCTVVDCIDSAIYSYGKYNKIIGNNIVDAGKDGIKINTLLAEQSSHNIVVNNTVTGETGTYKSDGGNYFVLLGDNNIVKDNTIEMLTKSPIVSGSAHGVVASGNNYSITSNSITGVVDEIVGVVTSSNNLTDTNENFMINLNNIDTYEDCIRVGDGTTHFSISDNFLVTRSIAVQLNMSEASNDNLVPLFANVVNNSLGGNIDATQLLSTEGADRVNISNNTYFGARGKDVSNPNYGGAIIGSLNMSDGFLINPAFSLNRASPRGIQYYIDPPKGTFFKGETVSGLTDGVVCTKYGTAGTINACTISSTSGSGDITMSAADVLRGGYIINVVGLTGDFYVKSTDGLNAVISPVADATVSTAAVSFSNPTWSTRANLTP